MSQLTAQNIRLACDQSDHGGLVDKLSGKPIDIWRGNGVAIRCALFNSDPAAEANFVDDLSNVVSATLNIRETNAVGTLLVTKTILFASMNGALTYGQWIAGTSQHFTFNLSATDTNFENKVIYFAISVATSAPDPITVGTGRGTITDDGVGEADEPEAPDYTSWSKAESDARYAGVVDQRNYVPLIFSGDAIDEQLFGYWKAATDGTIIGVQLTAQIAPTGSALTMDLVNGAGAEQGKIATLAAAASVQETIFGSALAVTAGDVIRGKIKSIGSTVPGGWLTATLIIQPT